MDNSTHDIRLANWKEIVRQCQSRPAGTTCKTWLAENNINEKQYYYWQRRIRNLVYQELQNKQLPAATTHQAVTFAEMKFSTDPGMKLNSSIPTSGIPSIHPDVLIRTPYLEIGMFNSASKDLIGSILKEINHA